MKFHLLALAMLAITSASGGVYARARNDNEQSTSTSTQSSLRRMFLNEEEASTSTRGLKVKVKKGVDDGMGGAGSMKGGSSGGIMKGGESGGKKGGASGGMKGGASGGMKGSLCQMIDDYLNERVDMLVNERIDELMGSGQGSGAGGPGLQDEGESAGEGYDDIDYFGSFKSIGYAVESMPITNRLGTSSSATIPMHVFYPADENPTAPNGNSYVISGKEFMHVLLSRSCEPQWFPGCNQPPILYPSLETLRAAWDNSCIPDMLIPINPTWTAETMTRDAAPAQGERPLIVFSHGLNLPIFMYSHLLMRLASYGYVVVAPVYSDLDYAYHLKNSQGSQALKPSLCNRFKEAREVINFMKTEPGIAEKYGIDTTRKVVAMGHSLGAATTLSTVLGGSLVNLGGCGFSDLQEPDDNVDLAITLAQTTVTPFGRAFTPEQVSNKLKSPVLALSIGDDGTSPPTVHVNDIFKEMKCKEEESVRIEIENGHHANSFTDIYPGLDLSGVPWAIGSISGGGSYCSWNQLTINAALGTAWSQIFHPPTSDGYRAMTPSERSITTKYPVSFLNTFLLGEEEYKAVLTRDKAVEYEIDLDVSKFVDDRETCNAPLPSFP